MHWCGEIEYFTHNFPEVERKKISRKHFLGVERLNISKKTSLHIKCSSKISKILKMTRGGPKNEKTKPQGDQK